MRVGTRITAATSVLVAVSLAVFGIWDLRRQAQERRTEQIAQARAVARALRATIEGQGAREAVARADTLSERLSRSGSGWRVEVVPASVANQPSDPRSRRVRSIIEARPAGLVSETEETLTYTLPLQVPSATKPDGLEIIGVLDVSASRAGGADLWRAIPLLLIIVGLVVVAVLYFTNRLVTRPIGKLIAGIDDVAEGDLSHVVLSEREDEIGDLATRFNEMTYSLRESRAETARQNQARHALEDRLFQTEKLATIGQLAAEIAHEVGTPLNVIVGRARGLAKKAGDPAKVAKNADIIAEQATRITRIIQRLLDFARRKVGTTESELVNLNEITLKTMEFLEARFAGDGIKHSFTWEEKLPPVAGQADQLQQVLLNLLINAIEATPTGGRVSVETSAVTRRRPGLEEVEPETYAVVEIADTGAGVPEADRERIFEPFYTSKDREGGTGLGLSVTQGIVKEHDGWVEIDNSTNGGARFRLFFPAAGPNLV